MQPESVNSQFLPVAKQLDVTLPWQLPVYTILVFREYKLRIFFDCKIQSETLSVVEMKVCQEFSCVNNWTNKPTDHFMVCSVYRSWILCSTSDYLSRLVLNQRLASSRCKFYSGNLVSG